MRINSQRFALGSWVTNPSLFLIVIFSISLFSLIASLDLPTIPFPAAQAMEKTNPVNAPTDSKSFVTQNEECFLCPANNTLKIGTQLFPTGRKVKLTILESDSALTSKIYVRPCPDCAPLFIGTNRQTGNMVCLDPATFPVGTEYVFEIVTETGNVFQSGPGTRNPIDSLVHVSIECGNQKPIISFEDLPGPGSDRDFNDVRLEVSCCDDECNFPLFYPPGYFLSDLHRLPGGAVFVGGVNFNAPVATRNSDFIRFALEGGNIFSSNSLQQLNREYVAAQLSLGLAGGDGSPTAYNYLWSPLRCLGQVGPVKLGNGFLFDSNSMLKDLFLQTRLAILENRTSDYSVLANLLSDLHCNRPTPNPGGETCPVQVAYPDLSPVQTKAGYCDRVGNQLVVTVQNASSAPAACTIVTVEFFTTNGTLTVEKEVSPISAFGSVSVNIDVPNGCFSPDCSFRITVNSKGCGGSPRILESRRSNNTVSGVCIG